MFQKISLKGNRKFRYPFPLQEGGEQGKTWVKKLSG